MFRTEVRHLQISRVPPCGCIAALPTTASPSTANTAHSATSLASSLLAASSRDVQWQSWTSEKGSHSRRPHSMPKAHTGFWIGDRRIGGLRHRAFQTRLTSAIIANAVAVTEGARKGNKIPFRTQDSMLAFLLLLAQHQPQSHHIRFTPWAVSRWPNDANAFNLILIPCAAARALLSAALPQRGSRDRSNDLHPVELSPLLGRVTRGADNFIPLLDFKTQSCLCVFVTAQLCHPTPCLMQHR